MYGRSPAARSRVVARGSGSVGGCWCGSAHLVPRHRHPAWCAVKVSDVAHLGADEGERMDRSNTRPQGVELFAIACQRHGLSLTNPDRIRGYNEIRYIAAPNFPTSKLPLRIPLRIVTGS